ncbi:MAG TPA: glycosyltransferase [Candidatus Acidoferrales bacterium]|nr:glycosyltransferase [Candidatus Acidoferrales bacterium]
MQPQVTVLWLNYNSMHLIDITKKSIDAVLNIDYPNLEIIFLDNNSTDGSQQVVEEYISEKRKNRNLRFVKLEKNCGYTGAMNHANSIRDPNSKYIALTHNDLIPNSDYLKKLVAFLESHKEIGAAQGIVVKLNDESLVDSYGFMMNEGLTTSSYYAGRPVSEIHKAAYVTFVEGTMPVYSLAALKTFNRGSELFVTAGFMYYLEDVFLSLKYWSNGFKCIAIPTVTGAHYRMGSSNKTSKGNLFHYLLRNRFALLYITNSASKLGFYIQNIRKLIVSNRTVSERKAILFALFEGFKLGRQLKRQYGRIDLYRAPLIRNSLKTRLYNWMH